MGSKISQYIPALRLSSLIAAGFMLASCGGGSGTSAQTSSPKTAELKVFQSQAAQLQGVPSMLDATQRERLQSLSAGVGPAPIAQAASVGQAVDDPRIEQYFIHYGDVTDEIIAAARQYQLVVLHPVTGHLTRDKVAAIQQGVNAHDSSDDVKVLLYISVGEDLRTAGLSDTQMAADVRFVGEGNGPRIDPRGVYPNGSVHMDNVRVLGKASPGGTGFASYYLDDNSVVNDPNALGDGMPDRNGIFGGAFVNIGDPSWFQVLKNMRLDGSDRLSGFQEILTLDYGRGFGADGVFLDTIDTAAPNHFTDKNSNNQSEFEWTAPGVKRFIERIRSAYPDSLILQNRGLFFFDLRHPHYQYNAGTSIDFLLFESFRLNSSRREDFSPFFFADNKHTIAPKLIAAASRDNGFQILSLGYAEGPSLNANDLFSATGAARATLMIDIAETQQSLGFRHYIGNAMVDVGNHFVRDNSQNQDNEAPLWSSIYNVNQPEFPTVATAPEPRVGVQKISAEKGALRVQWDVASDKNPVTYHAYWQPKAFDFSLQQPLAEAKSKVLKKLSGADIGTTGLASSFAFQDVIEDLSADQEYHVLIRAQDSQGNTELNTKVLQARPKAFFAIDGEFAEWAGVDVLHRDDIDSGQSAGTDFLQVKAFQQQQQLFLYFDSNTRFSVDGTPRYSYSRNLIFIDADNDSSTGYPVAGVIGSDYVINGRHLYRQSATQFNGGFISTLDVALNADSTAQELLLPLGLLGESADQLKMIFVNDEFGDYAPNYGGAIELQLAQATLPKTDNIEIDGDLTEWQTRLSFVDGNDSPESAGPDWQTLWLTSDMDFLYLAWRSEHAYQLDGSPDYSYSRNLFLLDTDEDIGTGYAINGMGSDYLIAGDTLYRQELGQFNAGTVQALNVAPKSASRSFEMALPLPLIGGGQWLRMSAVNDESFDLLPNSGNVIRLDKLNGRSVMVASTQANQPLRVDGEFSEWAQIPVYLYDNSNDAAVAESGPDWRKIKLAHDADNLYLMAQTANRFNLNGSPAYTYSRSLIFIDSDNNADTGYQINGIGSDLVINGDAAFSQSREQFAKDFLGRIPLAAKDQTQRFELSLPRSWLIGDPAQVKLQLLNDEVLDYAPERGSSLSYRFR